MRKFKGTVQIQRRPGVLDPEATTIFEALGKLGYNSIEKLSTAKVFVLNVDAKDENQAKTILEEIGHKVLSNPVIEDAIIRSIEEL